VWAFDHDSWLYFGFAFKPPSFHAGSHTLSLYQSQFTIKMENDRNGYTLPLSCIPT
jgi:hypothetical protein